MADAIPLLQPKEFVVTDEDGRERKFILSKFDAVAGREIVSKYPVSAMPVIGDYAVSEETMFKLMNYVAIETSPGSLLRLGNRALINNHVGTWENLAKIEVEMMKYNCGFFRDGTASSFLDELVQKILKKISEISTRSSAPSSQTEKLP
jgi:hypothetical protein